MSRKALPKTPSQSLGDIEKIVYLKQVKDRAIKALREDVDPRDPAQVFAKYQELRRVVEHAARVLQAIYDARDPVSRLWESTDHGRTMPPHILWLGAMAGSTPVIRVGDTTKSARRVAYEAFTGVTPPNKAHIQPVCGVALCVNPLHLSCRDLDAGTTTLLGRSCRRGHVIPATIDIDACPLCAAEGRQESDKNRRKQFPFTPLDVWRS